MASTEKKNTLTRSASAAQPRRRDAGRARGESIAEAVLERTLEELATVGVAQLSIDRIARAADVNKTSVYRRWPTREALVAAALERVLGHLSLQQRDTGSLRGDLQFLGESIADFLAQPAGRALAQAAFAETVAPAIAALAQRQLAASAGGSAAAMVQRAVNRGEWRDDADPTVVFSMMVGAILHRTTLERSQPTHRWLEQVVDVLLRGIRPGG